MKTFNCIGIFLALAMTVVLSVSSVSSAQDLSFDGLEGSAIPNAEWVEDMYGPAPPKRLIAKPQDQLSAEATGWQYNRLVESVYAHTNTATAYAIIEDVNGWIRIAATSPDGVTNVLNLLIAAKANERRVNVYIANDEIQAAYLL